MSPTRLTRQIRWMLCSLGVNPNRDRWGLTQASGCHGQAARTTQAFWPRLKDIQPQDLDRIIEMAWEDRSPFDAIDFQFNLKEKEVIQLMRSNLKTSSFKMWRKRVTGRMGGRGTRGSNRIHEHYRKLATVRNCSPMFQFLKAPKMTIRYEDSTP